MKPEPEKKEESDGDYNDEQLLRYFKEQNEKSAKNKLKPVSRTIFNFH